MNKDKIYIAYGSNLNLEQMAHRCPSAKVLGASEIKNYELLFRGSKAGSYATIEPCKDKIVPVLLWSVNKQDEKVLDRYEGYPNFYQKENMKLTLDGKPVNAFAYIMTDGCQLGIPSQNYLNIIADAYQEIGFNLDFLKDALNETKLRMEDEQEFEREQGNSPNLKWWW